MPQIFHYSNYRSYLKDWFAEKKKAHPAFSLRSLAKKSRSVPHSTFWMVMRGERNLTSVSMRQFLSILQFEEKEALYFEILVMFNQFKGWELKQRQLERIVEMRLSLNTSDVRMLRAKTEANLYSTWYGLPIFVMLEFPDFKSDPAWISKKLGAKVSEAEVRRVIDDLMVAGLVEYRDGRLTKLHSRIDMDASLLQYLPENRPPPIYFSEMSKKAADAYSLPRSEFAGAAGTMMANKADLPLVRERLNEAVSEINAFLDKSSGSRELYQIAMTFFPLGAPITETQKKKIKRSR